MSFDLSKTGSFKLNPKLSLLKQQRCLIAEKTVQILSPSALCYLEKC